MVVAKKPKTLTEIVQKKATKIEATKERKEQDIVNKLLIEMNPNGLFSVRYSFAGQVPEELKGLFTRKDRILAIANRRNIPVEQ